GFRQRSDLNPGFPWHPGFKLANRFTEGCEESIDDFPVNKQDLKSRAPLAVEGEGTLNAFLHGLIRIRVLQDDPGILGFEPEHATQTMRLWMLFFQNVGNAAAANEGQYIDSSGFHQRTDDFLSLSVDRVDNTP